MCLLTHSFHERSGVQHLPRIRPHTRAEGDAAGWALPSSPTRGHTCKQAAQDPAFPGLGGVEVWVVLREERMEEGREALTWTGKVGADFPE